MPQNFKRKRRKLKPTEKLPARSGWGHLEYVSIYSNAWGGRGETGDWTFSYRHERRASNYVIKTILDLRRVQRTHRGEEHPSESWAEVKNIGGQNASHADFRRIRPGVDLWGLERETI